MFREVLSVLDSQAANERAFRNAGVISASRRSNIVDECSDDISFVHGNFALKIDQQLGLQESKSVAELSDDAEWEELRQMAPREVFPSLPEEQLENVEQLIKSRGYDTTP